MQPCFSCCRCPVGVAHAFARFAALQAAGLQGSKARRDVHDSGREAPAAAQAANIGAVAPFRSNCQGELCVHGSRCCCPAGAVQVLPGFAAFQAPGLRGSKPAGDISYLCRAAQAAVVRVHSSRTAATSAACAQASAFTPGARCPRSAAATGALLEEHISMPALLPLRLPAISAACHMKARTALAGQQRQLPAAGICELAPCLLVLPAHATPCY